MDTEKLARRFADQFETATRDDGVSYVKVRDDAPDADQLHDLTFETHGNGRVLPDDTLYKLTRDALDHIADGGDVEDAHEFADGACDTYNSDLVAWLNANVGGHGDYIAQAIDEFGPSDRGFFHMIAMGQYVQAQEVFASVVEFLNEFEDEEDEDEEDEDDAAS